MSQDAAQFVFMTCRGGAESALKREVARVEPEWRPSFSRPGFMTFKHTGDGPLDVRRLAERGWTFAYADGISLGRLAGTQLSDLVQAFWQHPGVAEVARSRAPLDIHVWQREPVVADERGTEIFVTPLCLEIEAALRTAAPENARIAQYRDGSKAHAAQKPRARRGGRRAGRVVDRLPFGDDAYGTLAGRRGSHAVAGTRRFASVRQDAGGPSLERLADRCRG